MGEEDNQIVFIFFLSAAFVVFLAVLLILFVVVYQKRIVHQEIKLQKLQNEQQKILLKASIEGQERERHRLAKELHDGIGSLLSGLSLHLKFHKSKVSINPDNDSLGFLTEACKLVDEGLENVRSVSHNLLPATLEKFGLITAIQECIEPVNNSKSIKVNLQTNIIDSSILPKDVSLGLLRIFQELLQNTVKHSNATSVDVSLLYEEDTVCLRYIDDGQGIDMQTTKTTGIGIKNMKSRAHSLEGDIKIVSSPNKGFKAETRIPI